jgi:uncharacterized protein
VTPIEEELRARLAADLRAALKARAGVRVAALRSLIAALDNASAVDPGTVRQPAPFARSAEVPRRELSAPEVAALLDGELAERQAAAAKLRSLGRAEAAERALAEAQVIAEHTHARP